MSKLQVAYLRVSTETQTEKYGLDVQKQKIMDYCEKHGITIDKWYIDGGYSGSKLDRPEIQELLNHAKSGIIDTVYIYKLDRMSRDVIDTLNLFYKILPGYGVKVISMTEELRTENPMDRMMLTMNAAMNQYEREVIRMRMSAGMLERVKKGYWMGGGRTPWGYYYDRNDGILHINEQQASMVRKVYDLYLNGFSCENISKILGFKGEPIVKGILKRKSNIGLIEYKGKVYKGRHEPIIDEKVFWKVQDEMKKRHTNAYLSSGHLLTGLCHCGYCGARMRYQKWTAKTMKLVCYSHYQSSKAYMRKSDCCKNHPVDAYKVEAEVEECFKNFAININEYTESHQDSTEILVESLKKSDTKVRRLYGLYADNPSENLLDVIKEEEENIKKLKKKLDDAKTEKRCDPTKIAEIRHMSDIWDSLTLKEKNKILKQCVEDIVVDKDEITIRFVTL